MRAQGLRPLPREGGLSSGRASGATMCRLLGLLGSVATPAEPWLIGTDRSLLAQSNANADHLQDDGWGVGWYDGRRLPRVEKGARGAFRPEERPRFTTVARQATGPVVVAHLRNASNPMHLPRERLLGLENSQPFQHEGMLFAHNGSIPFPRETRPLLGKYEPNLRGVNDSEVLFWLLVKHTEALGDPLAAYAATVEDLVRVWADRGRPAGGPFTGLNVLFTRGPNELWAFCLWHGDHGGALIDRTRPYYQMAHVEDAKLALVGSEPFDSKRTDWRGFANGSYLSAHAAHGLVAVKTGPIPGLETLPAPPAAGTPGAG